MQRASAVTIAMLGLSVLTQGAVLRAYKATNASSPAAAGSSPAAATTPRPVGVGDPKAFADLLPFHPAGQPQVMFKSRCEDFLNHVLEKSAYDAAAVEKLMPKSLPPPIAGGAPEGAAGAPLEPVECKGEKPSCPNPVICNPSNGKWDCYEGTIPPPPAALLLQVASVAPGLPFFVQIAAAALHAVAPAGDAPPAAPAGADGKASLYGWCDKMFEMTHQRALASLNKAAAPAPAPAAAPVAAA